MKRVERALREGLGRVGAAVFDVSIVIDAVALGPGPRYWSTGPGVLRRTTVRRPSPTSTGIQQCRARGSCSGRRTRPEAYV